MTPVTITSILNQTVLIGLIYLDENHHSAEQIQVFGKIVETEAIDPSYPSLTLETPIEEWTLPLHLKSMRIAPRGEYKLLATGEQVSDPDFIATWIIYSPSDPQYPGAWQPTYASYQNDHFPPHWDYSARHDEADQRNRIDQYRSEYIGKTVLVGISYYRKNHNAKELVKREQLFGEIIDLSYPKGISLMLKNGQAYTLPPDITSLEPAEPMIYHLKSSGEEVTDPDYLSVWTVTMPEEKE